MKLRSIIFSMILVVTLMFTGCKSGVTQEVSKQQYNEIKSEKVEKINYALSNIIGYKINRIIWEDLDSNTKIFYPQITEYKGELLMDYMNQSLKNIVDVYGKKDVYKDIIIDYEITKADDSIISVVFKGKGKTSAGRDIVIQQSLNLDIKSSNEISFDNLIKRDKASRNRVKSILNEEANDMGLKHELEAEGIRVYFEDENVMFYYMPLDDSATDFVEIILNKNKLDGLLNIDFGEKPAS